MESYADIYNHQLISNVLYELSTDSEEYMIANHYHAPYVVWGMALRDGLITKTEYQFAKEHIHGLWNYIGD